MPTEKTIPVLRPRLPELARLEPYLRRIDEARVYSNWGPLTSELEARIAGAVGLGAECAASAGSGTAALAGACLATAGRATPDRPLAVVPAFTFVATALALEECGYEVFVADVDPETWALDPERIAREVSLERVGIVVAVAPYGRPLPQEPWRAFRAQTGVPVVIDAAASFELLLGDASQFVGDIPIVLSLHATKTFSTGEGGCVLTTSTELAESVTQALNFGFRETRDSATPGINGKLSEYHAAIGLADLDGWDEKQRSVGNVTHAYTQAFAEAALESRLVVWPEIASCYTLLACTDADEAERVRSFLQRGGIDFRSWYGRGIHRNTHFADRRREPLPVSERLAATLLGLPTAPDLEEADIRRVAEVVAAAVA